MMKNLYINKVFLNPLVVIRYPLQYNQDTVLVIEETPILDHSVYILERFCLENLYRYITKKQLIEFANLSDGQLLFMEDFTLPIKSTVSKVFDLIHIYGLKPNNIWFNLAWSHQKEEFETALHEAGIHGINVRIHNCYLREIYVQYIENKSLFDSLDSTSLKRFSVFTRRFNDDRLKLFLKLIDQELLKDCEYTFTNFHPELKADPLITKEEIKKLPMMNLFSNKAKIEQWINGLPYCLDVNDLRESFPLGIYQKYKQAGINIVVETLPVHRNNIHVQDIMITEKTYKAIVSQKPFMIYGPSGSLELLKKEGFRTFDSMIDESYDTIDDIDIKQNLILSELKKFDKLTDAEYFRGLESLNKTVDYNLRRFMYLGQLSCDHSIYTDLGLIQK